MRIKPVECRLDKAEGLDDSAGQVLRTVERTHEERGSLYNRVPDTSDSLARCMTSVAS
jgi:hypothetical protein